MNKLKFLDSFKNIDYNKIGLKCGIEVHQQLNTKKLFCSCPCEIVPNETLDKNIERKLRFSLSETGEVDKAALNEFKKGKYNIYKYNDKIACLVDLDEQPPSKPNDKALNTAIKVAQMLNLKFFDKLQFMRKLIIDGSVTSGFQRTAILGFDGYLNTSFGKVEINGINLEEDSCRTISREHTHTIFSLDRQGIPLIEITTGPQIHKPSQALEVAKQIGNILRSFPETKRGLGTIRQDLNISITGGARNEIKGAQNLKLISDIIENELKRQSIHLSIIEELKQRGTNSTNFSDKQIHDISQIFENTNSKTLLSNMKEKDSAVMAIKLNRFSKILGHEMQENYRFATEISQRNKHHFPQIHGLFHSDELPNYGITEKEIELIKKQLKLTELDSFILIASKKNIAKKSLTYILETIEELTTSVPSEVRQVDSKGVVTKFLRPMPGSARMYPETDVPKIEITKEYLEKMKSSIPELYDKKLHRFSTELEIEESKIITILEKFTEEETRQLIKTSGKNAKYLYNIVFELPKDIKKRENIEPVDFRFSLLETLLQTAKEQDFNQKTIRDIFISLYKDSFTEVSSLKEYLEKKELISKQISEEDIELKIKEIISKNPKAPFGALMGLAMKKFNSSVDGKKISLILKKLLA